MRSRNLLTTCAAAVGLLIMASPASSAQAGSVSLGTADSFALLAGSTVTNTGPTVVRGDVGVSPGSATTGFAPGTVTAPGEIHANDSRASSAQADLATAYDNAAQRTSTATISTDLAGSVLGPGVYTSAGSLGLNGELTLDARGDPDAVFVFQARSDLLVGTSAASNVRLIGGAQACHVFWQVASSATIGVGSAFVGNVLARTSISLKTNATLKGRALAENGAVTLDTNRISTPACESATSPGTGSAGSKACEGGSTAMRPARPVLRSPRRGARVRAGKVRFRWRASARASEYKLIVDRHEMSTGCATRALMRLQRGPHTWQVVALGQGGSRSSPQRRFRAAKPSRHSRKAAARKRVVLATRNFVHAVNRVASNLNAAQYLYVITALSARGNLIKAIRGARAVGLNKLASHYQRVLRRETKRLNKAIAFNNLLARANDYGHSVAQKAHRDNPDLSPTALGNIEFRAASWYGNEALLKTTLRAATKKRKVHEITLKKGADLDRTAYSLYRALSVGARKTGIPYGGREGIHALPDAKGGLKGGTIGLRRISETKGKRSPAIDIKRPDGTDIKIHFRHGR